MYLNLYEPKTIHMHVFRQGYLRVMDKSEKSKRNVYRFYSVNQVENGLSSTLHPIGDSIMDENIINYSKVRLYN